ncbi:hypothetical protein HYV88_05500 [Candidatus Woesearchaeota archaeon]|nr:hypothetical protein [Candidatus Woesearchaeota archaeon]
MQATEILNFILVYLEEDLIPRFLKIIITPWLHKEALWLVIPLIVILFFIEAYFGRNKTEQIGWNTAFGNAVSLFWISVLLFKFLVENNLVNQTFYYTQLKGLILVGILLTWSLILLVSDYFHALSKKIAFLISSVIPVNVTAYIFISIIVGKIPIDKTTILASILLFIVTILFFTLFKLMISPSQTAERIIEKKKRKERLIRARKKEERRKKIQELKSKILRKI